MSNQSAFLTEGYEQPVNQNLRKGSAKHTIYRSFSLSVKIEVTSNIHLLGTVLHKVAVI